MFRWFRRLFARPAAAPVAPAVDSPRAPAPADRAARPPPISPGQLDRVDGTWHCWLFDRKYEGGPGLNDAEARVLEALAAILSSPRSGAALVRRMPGVPPQLLQSLRSADLSGSALARTVSSDPALVAAVVRLANNCRQGGATRIASVEQAMVLVGQEGLRQLVATLAFRPTIDLHAGFYTRRLGPRLWEHAERCAISARRVAADAAAHAATGSSPGSAVVDPFDAFLAGLLQNVGLIVALRIMDGTARGERRPHSDLFLARLGRDTRLLAASIARAWDFPETVARALLEQGGPRKDAPMSPLGRLLELAGYLGKVRILAENELLDEADAELFSGLPPQAAQCYSALAASRELLAQA